MSIANLNWPPLPNCRHCKHGRADHRRDGICLVGVCRCRGYSPKHKEKKP